MAVLEFTGERFRPGGDYSLNDLTDTMRALAEAGLWWWSMSVQERLLDLKMTLQDLERCLTLGEVVTFEVSPSRVEMRLEIRHEQGDVANYRPVVWLDRDGKLHCADIRDGTEGTKT